MASIVIRNIPDDVLKRFRERAKADGKSAEQLAREAIAEKAKPDREDAWRQIDVLRSKTRRMEDFDIVEEITRAREERSHHILGQLRQADE